MIKHNASKISSYLKSSDSETKWMYLFDLILKRNNVCSYHVMCVF